MLENRTTGGPPFAWAPPKPCRLDTTIAWGLIRVVIRHYLSGREERIPKAAAIIWVGPQKTNDALAAELGARAIADVRVVGDAYAPRRLTDAIREGHRAGREV